MKEFFYKHYDFSHQVLNRTEYAFWGIGLILSACCLFGLVIFSISGLYDVGNIFSLLQLERLLEGSVVNSIIPGLLVAMSCASLIASVCGLLALFIMSMAKTMGRLRDIFQGYDISIIAGFYFFACAIPVLLPATLIIFFIPSGLFRKNVNKTDIIVENGRAQAFSINTSFAFTGEDELAKFRAAKELAKQQKEKLKMAA
jgi:hypothetical protein